MRGTLDQDAISAADKLAYLQQRWCICPKNRTIGSTGHILNVNIAGGVVVARLVAAVIDGAVGSALGGCDGVLERVAAKIVESVRAGARSINESIMWLRPDWIGLAYHSG